MSVRARIVSLLVLALCGLVQAQDAPAPKPPMARQVEHRSEYHGKKFMDPFFWLREKSNPEVIQYLEAENAYTEAMTKDIKPFADNLYKEILGRIKQTDLSVPTLDRGYLYYSRTEEGKQYSIRCRRKATEAATLTGASEEVLLDLNDLAKDGKFFSLGDIAVSDDGNLLAYTTDTTGFRQYRLFVKDLRTGALLPDSHERVTSLEWCSDNRTLFFTTEDPVTKRSNLVWRHVLGEETELVYQEKDKLFNVGLSRTKDDEYLFLAATSTDTWETRYLPTDRPQEDFKVILAREKDHKYDVDHRDGLFYLRTNKGAKNFRLVTVPVADPAPKNWKELIPHRPDVLLEGVELFRNHAVVSEMSAALEHFRLLDFRTNKWHHVSFPESVYSAGLMGTPEYDSTTFRFAYQSMVTPNSVFDYDMDTHKRTLRKQEEVLGVFDPNLYVTERQWVVARDGAKIPLSIVYRKDVKRDGTAPLMLYGYGSYGFGMPASFSSSRLSFLDRGVIYVIAHVRGGNELGEAWHDDGMLLKKKNTFHDFIDSAEWLVANKWTSKDRLMIEGGSAGGLLMGVVANLRPDLFKAVHAAVPFLDVINTMMDASLPLTVGEYLEWGNPNEKAAFDYLLSYSPYDNLAKKEYPAILVTTSLNDSQVMYWEPAKYVAKLRTLKTDNNPLLLKVNMGAGHGGASGRYDRLKEMAFEYAWLMSQVGIKK